MWIDLNDEEIKSMLLDIKDGEGEPTGNQRILIPGFDLYSKEVGDGTGINLYYYIYIWNENFT